MLGSCQSVKDGLTGKKQNNTDEFLVEKKNPLVLPPEFDKLPEPRTVTEKSSNEQVIDLKDILTKGTSSSKTNTTITSNSSLEQSILEKIKSN